MSINQIISAIEDRLFPGLQLDVWERVVYWHLFCLSRLEERDTIVVGVDPCACATGISMTKLRGTLRSLAAKGCLTIDERSRSGHVIRLLLPSEIASLPQDPMEKEELDVEAIDFFAGRQYLASLLARERERCFYCLRTLTARTTVLDHATPQVNGGDNSYRNIVVACHECNALKGGGAADDFVRQLYRNGVLSQRELGERLEALTQLKEGLLRPSISCGGLPNIALKLPGAP